MLLGIISVIALGVGTVQSSVDLSESERLALEQSKPAVVQTIEQQPSWLLEQDF